MLRWVTRLGGIGFAVSGAAGLLGLLDVSAGDAALYLLTGLVFSYVSFGRWACETIRDTIASLGALYLFSGALVIVGLYALELSIETNDVMRIALGIISVVCARFLPGQDNRS